MITEHAQRPASSQTSSDCPRRSAPGSVPRTSSGNGKGWPGELSGEQVRVTVVLYVSAGATSAAIRRGPV
jgi:hypothetical protein